MHGQLMTILLFYIFQLPSVINDSSAHLINTYVDHLLVLEPELKNGTSNASTSYYIDEANDKKMPQESEWYSKDYASRLIAHEPA